MTPSPILALLRAPAFGVAARVLLTFMFWASGLAKLIDFNGAQAEMAQFGLHPPALVAVAVILVELGGAALVISGRAVWLGAGALGVFTVLTIPVAHAFWTMSGQAAFFEMLVALEHLSVVGALMVVAICCRPLAAAEEDAARSAVAAVTVAG